MSHDYDSSVPTPRLSAVLVAPRPVDFVDLRAIIAAQHLGKKFLRPNTFERLCRLGSDMHESRTSVNYDFHDELIRVSLFQGKLPKNPLGRPPF
jgi:hypothetical protein